MANSSEHREPAVGPATRSCHGLLNHHVKALHFQVSMDALDPASAGRSIEAITATMATTPRTTAASTGNSE